MNISFIGFGSMAQALAKGLIKNPMNTLRAAAPSLSVGINERGIQTDPNNLAVIPDADILILAVKPAQMNTVLMQLNTIQLPKHCLIISIASGLSLHWFANLLPQAAIVRAMPNIAAAVGKGATPLIANAFVTPEQKKMAEEIFISIGIITWAKKESLMDAFTALSGSGPAYVFLFLEAIIAAGIDLGINDAIAKNFALQTFNGALCLAAESKLSLAELRKTVTSPAGTTAAAMAVFTKNQLNDTIRKAMEAAFLRAQALGGQG